MTNAGKLFNHLNRTMHKKCVDSNDTITDISNPIVKFIDFHLVEHKDTILSFIKFSLLLLEKA